MKETTKIFGIRTVIEAIQSDKTIDKIYIQKGLSGDLFQELRRLIEKGNYNISYVPVEKLNKLSKGNHQGVVATISPIQFRSIDEIVAISTQDGTPTLYLLLDQVTDARNFGAMIRTAECCGVSAIIIPSSGGAPVNADTIKTSAGAVFNIPICKVDHIKDAIYYLQSTGIHVVAATEKTEKSLFEVDFKQPSAIVMGNEAKGVTPSVLKLVDEKVKLPMYGTIESLNVSVACGAFLYEAVRQRTEI